MRLQVGHAKRRLSQLVVAKGFCATALGSLCSICKLVPSGISQYEQYFPQSAIKSPRHRPYKSVSLSPDPFVSGVTESRSTFCLTCLLLGSRSKILGAWSLIRGRI